MTGIPRVFETLEEAQAAVDYARLFDRVAALEEMLANPSRWFILPSWQPLTAEQEAELRSDIEAAQKAGPYKHRILPSVPPLTPEQVRYLLRECVTVVKPGETLIVRIPVSWHPERVRNYQEDFNAVLSALELPFRILVAVGEELGIAEPGGIPGAA